MPRLSNRSIAHCSADTGPSPEHALQSHIVRLQRRRRASLRDEHCPRAGPEMSRTESDAQQIHVALAVNSNGRGA